MSRSRDHSAQFVLTSVCLVLFTSSAFAGRILNLKEGASCGTGQVCKKIAECDSANKNVRIRRTQNILCGHDREHLPIVCCSPSNVSDRRHSLIPEKKTISEKMCQKYAEYVYDPPKYAGKALTDSEPPWQGEDMCKRLAEPLIIGGKNATAGEFPHMVQIGYGSPRAPPQSRDAWLCAGSLISERFVLSAGHCRSVERKPSKPPSKMQQYVGPARWARMGVVNTTHKDKGPAPLILKIVQSIIRKDYTSSGYNDIMLFKLEKDVTFSPDVRPICLQVNQYIEGYTAIATGWKMFGNGTQMLNNNIIKKVELNIIENDDCNKKPKPGLFTQGIKDTQMCAGDKSGEDTCPGDSGGPLQIPIKDPYCMYSLVGITSGGGKCGLGEPGVYTRVSKYIPWIEEHVWPKEK